MLHFISEGSAVHTNSSDCLPAQTEVQIINQGLATDQTTIACKMATDTNSLRTEERRVREDKQQQSNWLQKANAFIKQTVEITAGFASTRLPCVRLCSALWGWGRGRRSCGWFLCWLATASSRQSTGSRPSLPIPRRRALQHKQIYKNVTAWVNERQIHTCNSWPKQDMNPWIIFLTIPHLLAHPDILISTVVFKSSMCASL